MEKLLNSFLIFILITSVALGAREENLSVKLAKQKSQIMTLGASLSQMEKDLGRQNDRYLNLIDRLKVMEADLEVYREKLADTQESYLHKQEELAEIMRSWSISIVENDHPSSRAFAEMIKVNHQEISKSLKAIRSLEKIIKRFSHKITQLKTDEESLLLLTKELEERHSETSKSYLTQISKRDQLEKKLITYKAKVKATRKKGVSIRMSSPLRKIKDLISSKKGVTLKFDGRQEIRATATGRVIYNGELANYGKVIMLDHGKEIKSVLLGQFSSKLKKNDKVQLGDVIGYTSNDHQDQSLYFEVRKKNNSQNTIYWLDQETFSKI